MRILMMVFIGMSWVLLDEDVKVAEHCRMLGRRGDRRLGEERGDLEYFGFFSMSFYSTVYGVVTASMSYLNLNCLSMEWLTPSDRPNRTSSEFF
jgi:hypothetical protein